jgi:hypothetical protein
MGKLSPVLLPAGIFSLARKPSCRSRCPDGGPQRGLGSADQDGIFVVPGQFGAADRTHNEPRGLERRQRWLGGFGTDSSQTPRWREMDSNFQYAGAVKRAVTPARLRRVGAPFLPTILSGTRPKATRSAIAVAGVAPPAADPSQATGRVKRRENQFTAPAYQKFKSSPLQRGVCE